MILLCVTDILCIEYSQVVFGLWRECTDTDVPCLATALSRVRVEGEIFDLTSVAGVRLRDFVGIIYVPGTHEQSFDNGKEALISTFCV